MALARQDLWSLDDYEQQRGCYRQHVMAHKRHRQMTLHGQVRLLFEDQLTVQYQIQEMLRIEKIADSEGIAEELATYNPLIPDGHNLKATMLLEYPDVNERRQRLAELINVEQGIWLKVDGYDRVFAICNEDLERSNDSKTSSVHFLRFELTGAMITALQQNASLQVGVDHPAMSEQPVAVEGPLYRSLCDDLLQTGAPALH